MPEGDRDKNKSAAARPPGPGNMSSPSVAGPLLPWLLAALQPMPQARVKQLLHFGKVTVNGVATTQFDYPLNPGDCVAVAGQKSGQSELSKAGVSILFADDDLLVVDKPVGLLTVAFGSQAEGAQVFALLLAHTTARQMGRPFVVHRLSTERLRGSCSLRAAPTFATVCKRIGQRW